MRKNVRAQRTGIFPICVLIIHIVSTGFYIILTYEEINKYLLYDSYIDVRESCSISITVQPSSSEVWFKCTNKCKQVVVAVQSTKLWYMR